MPQPIFQLLSDPKFRIRALALSVSTLPFVLRQLLRLCLAPRGWPGLLRHCFVRQAIRALALRPRELWRHEHSPTRIASGRASL